MQMQGEATRITIYIGESDRYHGANLYTAILERLRREGAAGATVSRGIAGYGGAQPHPHCQHRDTLHRPAHPDRVGGPARPRGAAAARHPAHGGRRPDHHGDRPGRPVLHRPQPGPPRTTGRQYHAPRVVTVTLDTPVAELVTLLLARGVRSLPVVEGGGALVGIITDGDLLRRAGLAARLGLQPALTEQGLHDQLAALAQSGAAAAGVMTTPVITVGAGDKVSTVVANDGAPQSQAPARGRRR